MPASRNPADPQNREAPITALAALSLFVIAFIVSTEPSPNQILFLIAALAILVGLIIVFGKRFSRGHDAIQPSTVRKAATAVDSFALIGSGVVFLAPKFSLRFLPPPARIGIWLSQPPWQSNPGDPEPALLARRIATDVLYVMSDSGAVVQYISTQPPTDTLEAVFEYSVANDIELLICGTHPPDEVETAYRIAFLAPRTRSTRLAIPESFQFKIDAPRVLGSTIRVLKDDFGYSVKFPYIPTGDNFLAYVKGRSEWNKRDVV